MKRSGGVTASGVIAIIGSLLAGLLGILLIVSTVSIGVAPPSRISTTIILIVESIILLSLCIFGIISAIGLLKLKNWARVSFLVFGGLLSTVSIMAMLGTFAVMFLSPQMMPPEHAILGLFGMASVVAGIGMLRWRASAHSLALAIYGFALLNTAVVLVVPGSLARMQSAMQEIAVSQNQAMPAFPDLFVRLSLVAGIFVICVPIWFLIARRRAFLEACSAASLENLKSGEA